MKIGIDINPILEKVVGKGFFLKNMLIELSKLDSKNEYFLYGFESPSLDLRENFKFKQIEGKPGLAWDLRCMVQASLKDRVNVFLTVKSFYSAILHPKSVFVIHDVGPLKIPSAYPENVVKSFKHLLKLALKLSKRIITPSSVTKSYIVNKYNISHKKIKKIPEAAPRWTRAKVEEEDIARVKKKYNLPENYFLFAGTLEPRKNLINLVKGFKEFKKNDKDDFKLVIVGKKGYKYDEIFKKVIDMEVSQDVIFTGHIPEFDLKPVFMLSNAFILVSILEGFALSALEAMACEKPVICSRSGAIKETVDNACLEVDPLKTSSIAKAMEKITSDKDLRDTLIKRGLKRVKTFSWEKSAKKLLRVFKEI
jgi:glycosyltransferase involved in cell wall biosynthesis